jgi:hypothetical protein
LQLLFSKYFILQSYYCTLRVTPTWRPLAHSARGIPMRPSPGCTDQVSNCIHTPHRHWKRRTKKRKDTDNFL